LTEQIKPLPQGAPIWQYETSKYPDLMKQPMEDGHVETYYHEPSQPDPRVMKSIDLIRKMNRMIRENVKTYGTGGYKPKHKKMAGERYQHSADRGSRFIIRAHDSTESEEK